MPGVPSQDWGVFHGISDSSVEAHPAAHNNPNTTGIRKYHRGIVMANGSSNRLGSIEDVVTCGNRHLRPVR